MEQTLRYNDRTIAVIARLTKIATLAGIATTALALAGVADFNVPLTLFLTAFCAVAAAAYQRGTPVELTIGPEGISKRQALGMGWQVDWSDITEVVRVPLRRPMLAVLSPKFPTRRGPAEWPVRNAQLPANAHSVPATSDITTAIAAHYGREIGAISEH